MGEDFAPSLRHVLLSRNLLDAEALDSAYSQANRLEQNVEDYLYKSGLISHLELQKAIATSKGQKLATFDGQNSTDNFTIKQNLCPHNGYNLLDNYHSLNPIYSANSYSYRSGFSENTNSIATPTELITARDFRQMFIQQNKQSLNNQAANLLAEKAPKLTAKFGLSFRQKLILLAVLLTFIIFLFANPIASIYYFSFGASILFLFISIIKVCSLFLKQKNNDTVENIEDVDLPVYSILVPLYKEEAVIERLTQNLLNLNYPRSKLDIKLLFEEDDEKTLEIAKSLNLPECFEFISIAVSLPKTKPKAMNFALPFVKGEFVTIYDAEDKPEPNQLRKAVAKFRREDESLVCLQASLEFENWQENWLSKHFFIEYATQFNRFLPTLEKMRIPLPLGGTSNHFKTKILRELFGWDAYNVTEDADLGIRLALKGYRSATLNSVTLEEANHRLIPWLKQRTRWLKGWLQTIIVHSRHPSDIYSSIGLWRYLGFVILMSNMMFSSLMHPLIIALPFIVYFYIDFSIVFGSTWHLAIFLISLASLIIGYGSALIANFQAIKSFKRWGLLITLISAPLYWLLISIAAWNAIADYIRRPFYWSKTEHGVSKTLNKSKASNN